jgi:hypothetical protein
MTSNNVIRNSRMQFMLFSSLAGTLPQIFSAGLVRLLGRAEEKGRNVQEKIREKRCNKT